MNIDSLKYIKAINGTLNKSCVDSFRDEMINQYNEANKNVITEFSILINSDKAQDVKINDMPSKVLIKYNKKEIQVKSFINALNTGDYIYYFDKESNKNHVYLNTSIPKRIRDYEYHLVEECGQELCFSFTKNPIPCIAQGESYGVKITGGTEFNTQVDTKVKVTVQNNEETRKIKPDHRFIFNHSEYGVYKIGDVTVYNHGLLVFTCQKDEYMQQHDDLENNIAFNGDIKPPIDDQVKTYSIKGCPNDEMIMGKTETFTLEPPTDGVTWVINNELSINPNVAEIVSQDTNTCVVKCNVGDDCFEIQGIKDKQVINANKKLILTARR